MFNSIGKFTVFDQAWSRHPILQQLEAGTVRVAATILRATLLQGVTTMALASTLRPPLHPLPRRELQHRAGVSLVHRDLPLLLSLPRMNPAIVQLDQRVASRHHQMPIFHPRMSLPTLVQTPHLRTRARKMLTVQGHPVRLDPLIPRKVSMSSLCY